jgi:response regulator RpfG family c-di-GMP phosphodiesterase
LFNSNYLTEEEWITMKKHPTFAGSGHPRGLKGEQIPLTARIFAVADVVDAQVQTVHTEPLGQKKGYMNISALNQEHTLIRR